MSLHAQPLDPIPELTSRIAHASFPKGTLAMDLRDALGSIYEDADFVHLFPRWGRAAEAHIPLTHRRHSLHENHAQQACRHHQPPSATINTQAIPTRKQPTSVQKN